MINLIPPPARERVAHEYWARVLTVWALLLGIAGIVSGFTLFPTYILLSTQHAALKSEADAFTSMGNKGATTEVVIREANTLAAALARVGEKDRLTDILTALDASLNESIELRVHSLARDEEGRVGTFRVAGVAKSREALTSFRSSLEARPEFEKAEIPISDLVHDTDLPFDMNILIVEKDI